MLKDGQQQKEGPDFPEFPDNDLIHENLVDLEIWGENQRGEQTTKGTATICLPARQSSPEGV